MKIQGRLILALLWVASLVAVAQWSAAAQAPELPGVEVRLLPSDGSPGRPHGILVGNFNGQWLPVTVDVLPQADGNSLVP